jgi:hypothetical protein
MTWTPERAGNWLFHCHMVSHISTEPAPSEDAKSPAHSPSTELNHGMGMTGLVMGITVSPGAVHAPLPAPAVEARKLQLVISENPEKIPSYKLDLLDPLKPNPPEQDKKTSSLLGPPIYLSRGQPAEIKDRFDEYYGGEAFPFALVRSPNLASIVLYRPAKPELNKIAMGCLFHRPVIVGRGLTDLDEATVSTHSLKAQPASL